MVDVPVPDDDLPLFASALRGGPALCSAFRCRAQITAAGGEYAVRSVLHGKAKRKKAATGDQADTIEVPLELSGAHHLVSEWLTLADGLSDRATRRAA